MNPEYFPSWGHKYHHEAVICFTVKAQVLYIRQTNKPNKKTNKKQPKHTQNKQNMKIKTNRQKKAQCLQYTQGYTDIKIHRCKPTFTCRAWLITQGKLNNWCTNAFSSSIVSLVRVLPLSWLCLLYEWTQENIIWKTQWHQGLLPVTDTYQNHLRTPRKKANQNKTKHLCKNLNPRKVDLM